ncbi:MAG: hypothetical protein V8S90_04485 [Lachnospiraceae bacterium]
MVYAMACADDNYMPSAVFQLGTAIKKGKVDRTLCYNINSLDEEFKRKNQEILLAGGERRRGCYLWKPYFVDKALKNIENGDFLIYMDSAGAFYRSCVTPIISYMKKHNIDMVGSRRYKYLEKHWTKRDAFVYMTCDTKEYTDQYQCWAGFFIVRKTENTQQIVGEWLKFAQDARIITDAPNTCGMDNYENFVENRHDQSILSLLMKKYDIVTIEELPLPDFYLYHHTRETSVRDVKKELKNRRLELMKSYLEKKDYKGIYYLERENLKNLILIQGIIRRINNRKAEVYLKKKNICK